MEGPLLRPLPFWRQRSGGLTMGQDHVIPYHQAVMIEQVSDLLAATPPGLVVDATFGGGGHTRALLEARPQDPILAIDQDPDAMDNVPRDPRLHFVAANFAELGQVLGDLLGPKETDTAPMARDPEQHESGSDSLRGLRVAGVLFDLGVSSHQLDVAERGFSYRNEGPLDMRMDTNRGRTASDIVNSGTADELVRIFRRWGEETHARRIALRIVAERPISTTTQLADVIARATPAAARRKRHPARRVFQALRIEVNDELGALASGLDAAIDIVGPSGRVVVISYHSLEDRLVKRRFAAGERGCTCPPDLPVCVCDETAELRRVTRGVVRPSAAEVAANRRSRSALLRAAEKVA